MSEGNVYDWLQRRPLLFDVPLAIALALLGLVVLGEGQGIGWAVVGLSNLALIWRRSRPATAFAVISIALALRVVPTSNLLPGDIAFLVALYSLAAYDPRRGVRLAGLGVAALGSAIAGVRFTAVGGRVPGAGEFLFTFLACAAASLAAWALGDLKRARLQRLTDLQDRAERIEREREQALRLAAQQERAAIAREMHDVVAHALSVIVVQADGAAYAAERSPEGALARSVGALETIGSTARDALSETRRLVGVLRDPESGVELAPTGGVAQLDDLVAGVRAAGVPVTLTIRGAERARSVGLDLAAYRVVQESLTNVIKHAGPDASAVVDVDQTDDVLRISVCDNGVGALNVDDRRGHGLPGMRERVTVHGGTLTAGPRAGGGFEVLATMPTAATMTTTTTTTKEER